jgi:hypothetical protein
MEDDGDDVALAVVDLFAVVLVLEDEPVTGDGKQKQGRRIRIFTKWKQAIQSNTQ